MAETSAGNRVYRTVRGVYIVARTAMAATGVVLGGVLLLRGIRAARGHRRERLGGRGAG